MVPSNRPKKTPPVGRPAEGRELRPRGLHTVQRLLDAGTHVFGERGYHAARVDDIVERARTSHGTFYLYFASKEDLFRTLAVGLAEHMVELAHRFPPLGPNSDDRAALRAWIEDFASLYEQWAPVLQAWTEGEVVDSEFGQIAAGLVKDFDSALAARLRDADIDLNPETTAVAIVAMIERLEFYLVAQAVPVTRDAAVDVLTDVTLRGLFGGRAPASDGGGVTASDVTAEIYS